MAKFTVPELEESTKNEKPIQPAIERRWRRSSAWRAIACNTAEFTGKARPPQNRKARRI
jgi:hypothetical protein